MWEEKKTVGQAAIIPCIQSRSFDPILALMVLRKRNPCFLMVFLFS